MAGGESEARVLPPVEGQDGWAGAGGEGGASGTLELYLRSSQQASLAMAALCGRRRGSRAWFMGHPQVGRLFLIGMEEKSPLLGAVSMLTPNGLISCSSWKLCEVH